jgi:hypothetical protein
MNISASGPLRELAHDPGIPSACARRASPSSGWPMWRAVLPLWEKIKHAHRRAAARCPADQAGELSDVGTAPALSDASIKRTPSRGRSPSRHQRSPRLDRLPGASWRTLHFYTQFRFKTSRSSFRILRRNAVKARATEKKFEPHHSKRHCLSKTTVQSSQDRSGKGIPHMHRLEAVLRSKLAQVGQRPNPISVSVRPSSLACTLSSIHRHVRTLFLKAIPKCGDLAGAANSHRLLIAVRVLTHVFSKGYTRNVMRAPTP